MPSWMGLLCCCCFFCFFLALSWQSWTMHIYIFFPLATRSTAGQSLLQSWPMGQKSSAGSLLARGSPCTSFCYRNGKHCDHHLGACCCQVNDQTFFHLASRVWFPMIPNILIVMSITQQDIAVREVFCSTLASNKRCRLRKLLIVIETKNEPDLGCRVMKALVGLISSVVSVCCDACVSVVLVYSSNPVHPQGKFLNLNLLNRVLWHCEYTKCASLFNGRNCWQLWIQIPVALLPSPNFANLHLINKGSRWGQVGQGKQKLWLGTQLWTRTIQTGLCVCVCSLANVTRLTAERCQTFNALVFVMWISLVHWSHIFNDGDLNGVLCRLQHRLKLHAVTLTGGWTVQTCVLIWRFVTSLPSGLILARVRNRESWKNCLQQHCCKRGMLKRNLIFNKCVKVWHCPRVKDMWWQFCFCHFIDLLFSVMMAEQFLNCLSLQC